MIARAWIASVPEGRASDYEQFAREVSIPMFRAQPGYCGVLMLRDGPNCVVITLWEGEDAIDRLGRSPAYRATVEAISGEGLLEGEQWVEQFEVHELDLVPFTSRIV